SPRSARSRTCRGGGASEPSFYSGAPARPKGAPSPSRLPDLRARARLRRIVTFEQKLYILVRNGLGAALVNALINGAIGWGITRWLAEFPVWKSPGVAADLLFTAFGITFGTSIVVPLQTKKDFSGGRVTLPALSRGMASFLARFPKGLLRRALVL